MVQKVKSFASFIKIEHTLFSLPLIYSGVFLAAKEPPSVSLLLLVLVGATGVRTAALALNRMIDREIDKRNPRTSGRELPSGRLSLVEASGVLLAGLMAYFLSAALLSPFCLMLSPLPLLVFTLYPYLKRFTSLAHFGVGLGVSMAPLGGWFAVQRSFENILPAILLTGFTILWVSGFDIIYSTLDELFDRKENLYSLTSRLGRTQALRISGYLHGASFVVLGILFAVYIRAITAVPFLLLSGYLLYLEHRKSEDVELAFFKINAVLGFSVFGMVLAGVFFR